MNKAELIQIISERTTQNKQLVEDVLTTFIHLVTETLQVPNGEINIAGFGAFTAKTRAARMGVNPQNPTQKIHIAAVRIPKFKAGKGLKDALKAQASISSLHIS